MRKTLILLPVLLIAVPAAAEPAPPAAQLPPQLSDPKVADRLADTIQLMSQAFLNLPVGDVQAAVEGRDPTPAERKMTLRDVGRRDDPNFDRNFNERLAQLRPTIEHGMRALNTALPAMKKALDNAQEAIDRAAANMPDPTYPER